MRSAPDSTPTCAPDSFGASGIALDSGGVLAIGIGAAADFFCAAKAAEGASPRTVEWCRMILIRAVRRFGDSRPVDAITAAELRAWLLELRSTLAPESMAGYVRGLKAFGNWCVAEELAAAPGFRALRRPHVPRRLIAPFSDAELRSLLALADERERALVLLLFDTELRLSEVVSLRVGDVRPFAVPELARRYVAAEGPDAEATRRSIQLVFATLHRLLGVCIGKHLGYLLTGLWTLLVAISILSTPVLPGWLGIVSLPVGVALVVGTLEFVGA